MHPPTHTHTRTLPQAHDKAFGVMMDAADDQDDIKARVGKLKRRHARGTSHISPADLGKAEAQVQAAHATYSTARGEFERCDDLLREFHSRGFAETALRRFVQCEVVKFCCCWVVCGGEVDSSAVWLCGCVCVCVCVCVWWEGYRSMPASSGPPTAVLQLLQESHLLVRRDLNSDYEVCTLPRPHTHTPPTCISRTCKGTCSATLCNWR